MWRNDTLEFVPTAEGRFVPKQGSLSTGRYEYSLKDHLGNLRVACTCDTALKVSQIVHQDPWGFTLPIGIKGTDRYKFLGREEQAETGWVDLMKRFYDPSVGRFLSVDPLPDAAGQESLSTYQYGWNNPVVKSDPNGDCPNCVTGAIGAGLGALIGGAIEAGTQLYQHGEVNNWKAVGGAALQGGITGGAAGFTGGASLLVTTSVSAGANVVGGAVNNAVQGKEITVKSVATDAAVGVVAGVGGKVLDKVVKGINSEVKVAIDEKRVGHIFRDAEGHFAKDTPATRSMIEKTANNPKNAMGTDKFGNQWSAQTQKDGTQIWTQSRNGKVINAGVNQEPRQFNSQTGLSAPNKPNQ